jgi:AAA ATPase containing von Willebrand factor type A (vWA) domain
LFPPPQLHANHLTKVDQKEMTKVDSPDDMSEVSGNSNPEELGDTYSDAPVDENHVDEMFEMDGLEGGAIDERELKADKEIDQRTEKEKSEQSDNQDADDTSDNESEKSEPTDKEGADGPIQKESEEVEEVAEATSKASEDVHGGDEATKDIEDSPNAADNGQNPDNEGADSDEGGDEGEGEGEGGADGEGTEGADGDNGSGSAESDAEGSDAKGEASGDPFATEDWEAKADHSATVLKLLDDLEEAEAKARDEKGHRTSLPQYNFDREASPAELEIAFKKAAELLKKFAAEEEITARRDGTARWDAEKLVRSVVTYRHQRIPSSKYEHPKEADICILLDISGSCAQQAEMFMAIAAGTIGSGVRVFVGYNGSCRACSMDSPKRRIRSYAQAKPWVQAEVNRVSGWDNAVTIGEWGFEEFLEEAEPKTVIIFGDWDGVDQYTAAVKNSKFRNKIKFFWFANEGYGSWRQANAGSQMPEGFTTKNYVPGIFNPRDFVKALRKLR